MMARSRRPKCSKFHLRPGYRDAIGSGAISDPAAKSQTVGELATTTFTTTFSGTPPVGIQWRRNGVNISGATNSTYTFSAGLTNHSAAYSVVLTNSHLGTPYTATSSNAVLSVTADSTAPVLKRHQPVSE